jgi:hypothetical protein
MFSSSEQRGTIDMNMFLQYSKEPEQMGLTIPLFVRCCQLRIAILDLEYRSLKRSYDYVTMAEVRIQRQQIDRACKSLLSTVSLPEQPAIHISKDSIIAALGGFLEELQQHYEALTDIDNGNFDAARRCRETQQELQAALDKLQDFVPGPDASRLSMMMMVENNDLLESDLQNMHMRLTEGGTMVPDIYKPAVAGAAVPGADNNSGAGEEKEQQSRAAENVQQGGGDC